LVRTRFEAWWADQLPDGVVIAAFLVFEDLVSLFKPPHLRKEALSIESISTRKKATGWWSLRRRRPSGLLGERTEFNIFSLPDPAGCLGGPLAYTATAAPALRPLVGVRSLAVH